METIEKNALRDGLTDFELGTEETLDPADWDALRALGHQMVDDMFGFLQTIRERPVWKPMPEDVQEHMRSALPEESRPAEDVYEEFKQYIMSYAMGNYHPRFWG